MVSRRSVPLVLVVACLVASVALSGMASSRTWMAGGHATPEQLALHQLYESLGVHDHHGHADVEASSDTVPGVTMVGIGPAWSVAVPGGAADPGQVARHSRDVDPGASAQLTTLMRIQPGDPHQPSSPDDLALDPPPRLAA
jgi:hypothetical protein